MAFNASNTSFVNGSLLGDVNKWNLWTDIQNETAVNISGNTSNTTGAPGNGRPNMLFAYIVLILTAVVQIIGIFGNILVVCRVAVDKKLRNVTFVILAALAISDGIALCSYLTASVIRQFNPTMATVMAVFALTNAAFFSSAFHVLFISIVRYLILIYPLETFVHLKIRYMIFVSILIFVISGVIGGVDLLIEDTMLYSAIMWTIYYLPLIVMIVLHAVKYYHLKHNRMKESSQNDAATLRTMTKIILFITLSSFLFPLPSCVLSLLLHTGRRFRRETTLAVTLVFSLNNCINPFLYCFLSPKFRNSVKECCCCCCRKTSRKDSRNTSMTATSTVTSRSSSLHKENSLSEKEEK